MVKSFDQYLRKLPEYSEQAKRLEHFEHGAMICSPEVTNSNLHFSAQFPIFTIFIIKNKL
jgi:hypothetical protein